MKVTVVEGGGMRLSLYAPAPALSPFVTVYYRVEVSGPGALEDWLPPEWANLRVGAGAIYEAAIGESAMEPVPRAVLSGPTSRVTRLRIGGDFQSWGIGLMPLGFATFVGLPVNAFADRFVDFTHYPQLSHLHALLESLMEDPSAAAANVARLDEALKALLDPPQPSGQAIVDTHRALMSGQNPTVSAVAARLGVSPRTLERFCARYFGFNPQLLLRRQRFLRSLAKFMIDPSMKWIASLDTHYHDQAHFVRDFRRFLGMRPSEYAARPHPIAITAARARREALGEAMQILHTPPKSVAA